MDEVTDFIDVELGIGVSPRPQVKPQQEQPQQAPPDSERQQYALDPSQPVILPGEDSGVQDDSS